MFHFVLNWLWLDSLDFFHSGHEEYTKFQISTTPSPLPTPPPLPFLPDVDPILFPLCRNVGKKWEGSQEMSNKWNQFGFSLLCDKHFLLVIGLQNSVLDLWRSIPRKRDDRCYLTLLINVVIGSTHANYLLNYLLAVEGGHRAIIFSRIGGIQNNIYTEGLHFR